jgi:hypothetical protein
MNLACGHPCQDDLAGAFQNVLAFIKEPKRMNGSIGMTTSVLEDQVFTVVEFFLIFLQLMGRMTILKKVDDLPVGGMGIVVDMAGATGQCNDDPSFPKYGPIEPHAGRGASCCEADERVACLSVKAHPRNTDDKYISLGDFNGIEFLGQLPCGFVNLRGVPCKDTCQLSPGTQDRIHIKNSLPNGLFNLLHNRFFMFSVKHRPVVAVARLFVANDRGAVGGDHTPGTGKPDDDAGACHSSPVGWQHCPTIDKERCLLEEAIILDIIPKFGDTHVFEPLRIMAVMIKKSGSAPQWTKPMIDLLSKISMETRIRPFTMVTISA